MAAVLEDVRDRFATAAARAGRSVVVESGHGRGRPGGPAAAPAGADEPGRQRAGARCGRRTAVGAARRRRPRDRRGRRGPGLRRRAAAARHRAVRAERALDRGRARAGDRGRGRRGERRHGGGGQRSRGCRGVALAPGGGGPAGRAGPRVPQSCRERREELGAVIEPGPAASGGRVGHQRLDPRVGRRRDAVQPAEQGDLAVEEVGLDPRPAGEALPGRPAGARLAADGTQLQVVRPAYLVLRVGDRVDPGRRERRLRLVGEQVERLGPSSAVEAACRTGPGRRCRGCSRACGTSSA